MKSKKITATSIRAKIKQGRERARVMEKLLRSNTKSENGEPIENFDFNFNIVRVSLGGDCEMILRDEVRDGSKNKTVLMAWENIHENKCLEVDLTEVSEEDISNRINDICSAAFNEGNNVIVKSMGE